MLVLPQNVIDKLNLRKMREVKVRYANNKTEIKPIYGVVTVEMCGRAGEFDVLAEPEGAQPLVGQIILEQLDLMLIQAQGGSFQIQDHQRCRWWKF